MDACEDASFVDYKVSGSRRATFRSVSPIRNVQRPVVHARTVVDDGYNRHFRLGRGCPTKARVKVNLPIVLDHSLPTYPIPKTGEGPRRCPPSHSRHRARPPYGPSVATATE